MKVDYRKLDKTFITKIAEHAQSLFDLKNQLIQTDQSFNKKLQNEFEDIIQIRDKAKYYKDIHFFNKLTVVTGIKILEQLNTLTKICYDTVLYTVLMKKNKKIEKFLHDFAELAQEIDGTIVMIKLSDHKNARFMILDDFDPLVINQADKNSTPNIDEDFKDGITQRVHPFLYKWEERK